MDNNNTSHKEETIKIEDINRNDPNFDYRPADRNNSGCIGSKEGGGNEGNVATAPSTEPEPAPAEEPAAEAAEDGGAAE